MGNLIRVNVRVLENKSDQMVLSMKDSGRTTWQVAWVDSSTSTAIVILAIGKTTKLMGKVNMSIQTGLNIVVNERMINSTGKV
jgi:hypothetical protein